MWNYIAKSANCFRFWSWMISQQSFKIIIVGNTAAGKSCILLRLWGEEFPSEHEATIGVAFVTQEIDLGDKKIILNIWDTAGQEIFRSITRSYYRETACVLAVYDLTDMHSFEKISDWVNEVREVAPPSVAVVLVANKKDITGNRMISEEIGRSTAESLDALFFEVSAKTGEGIHEMYSCALAETLRRAGETPPDPRDLLIHRQNHQKQKHKCCD